MNNISTELIYILVFVAFALVQYLLKRLRPPERQEGAVDGETFENLDSDVGQASAASLSSNVDIEHFDRAKPLRAPIALARNRFDIASLLESKQDMQNAIVLATILGPCRAYEPHDVR